MPRPFHQLTLDEFGALLEAFPWERKIDAVHMHHTWRPTLADYRGEATIEAMWRFHTQQNGWSDIAQHITIAPDGTVWTGRDWNRPPASASGHNGNAVSGPFMFETVGDFDRGRDTLTGEQRATVIGVIARVQLAFGLAPESLRFHRFMTDRKSCPGTGVDEAQMLDEVRRAREALGVMARAPRPAQEWAGVGCGRARARAEEILRLRDGAATRGHDGRAAAPFDGHEVEPKDDAMSADEVRAILGTFATTRAPAKGRGGAEDNLSPAMLAELRPHVVNLNQGRFSTDGRFQTRPADVDAIFQVHLERELRVAQANDRPLRLLFWAHGGLIGEEDGLRIAGLQVDWWKRNNIYPIHFVWETGFADALKQILSGTRALGRELPRDLADWTGDPAIELSARLLGGAKIWSAMKRSAELASGADGGAAYVAGRLAEFCKAHKDQVELHAVGHSAGSIFHAHFLPRAFAAGAPPLKTLQLLAPAITVAEFKQRLLAEIGRNVERLTMFTMAQDWEEDDSVAAYQKSLLYLIHYALEPRRGTDILGLEVSVRRDEDLREAFGLTGTPSPHAEVIWSRTQAITGKSASTSATHGGFDNDRPTMHSVLRRILRVADAEPIQDFPEEAVGRGLDLWTRPPKLPAPLGPLGGMLDGGLRPPVAVLTSVPPGQAPPPAVPVGPGRRRALCVGVDRYPRIPLAGCVADAREWAATLGTLGFEARMLLDEAATRDAILGELRALVGGATAGDVVVFQFAGHGTELEDTDGDEADGTNGGKDEALCPIDLVQGAFVIDDDLAGVFARIPPGVNVTCFIDCCHSGTVTRLGLGAPQQVAGAPVDRRARFLPATADMQAAHRTFRASPLGRGAVPKRTAEQMTEVLFSACLDSEVAFETDGHGEFTRRATHVLGGGIAGLSHEEFARRVVMAFGPGLRQHPDLDCAPAARSLPLLQPLGASASSRTVGVGAVMNGSARYHAAAGALRAIAEVLDG